MRLLALLLCLPFLIHAQEDNKQKARNITRQAIRIMDNGDPDRAITMLDSARLLDPDDYIYVYEIGFAYYLKKDYPKSIEAFQQSLVYKNATDQCYQMLGNTYDIAGDRVKAIETYNEGLKKYPGSGRLYLELGNIDLIEKDYDEAITWWEKGIAADPKYSSNYYRLAKLYADSKDRLWALFYGELFMNIERNSKRTAEISQLLYDTYKASIITRGDSTRVDLTDNVIALDDAKKFRLPFNLVYGTDFVVALTPSLIKKDTFSIRMISNARSTLVANWFRSNRQKDYPNILLDFQKQLNEKGYLNAYTYWLLMKGNEAEFGDWYAKNKTLFDAFAAWFNENPLTIDTSHYFLRTQYD